jgi:hypothetical protein
MKTETPRRMIETRNGMRQPQLAKLSGLMTCRRPRITASERKKPRVAVVWIQLV